MLSKKMPINVKGKKVNADRLSSVIRTDRVLKAEYSKTSGNNHLITI
jgi:hypothetical protein